MCRRSLTTEIKNSANSVLRLMGLQVGTTMEEKAESSRLKQLSDRGHWSVPRYTQGLSFAPAGYRRFLDHVCSPYRQEFVAFPRYSDNNNKESGFFLYNEWFESVDAEVLYCLVRHLRPARVIEIGSGFSTRVMHRAICDAGLQTKLISIDPIPRVEIAGVVSEQIRQPVESVEICRIADPLRANDILFVDSSHVVITGGDLPYLCLEVLPNLRPGVYIHFHDIFLPFDYPQQWVLNSKCGWNEQYLLHALLANNPDYQIVWPSRYMWTQYRDDILRVIPCDPGRTSPSSLWLKKCGTTGAEENSINTNRTAENE
jgi:hypothetical protein